MKENMSALTRRSLFESIFRANCFYADGESFLDLFNLNFTVDSINTQKLIYPERAASTYIARYIGITGEVCDSPCSSDDAGTNNGSTDKSTTFKTELNLSCSANRPFDVSLPSKNLQKQQIFCPSITGARKQNTNSHKRLKESDLQPITQTPKSRRSAIAGLSGMVIDLSADYYIKP